MPSGRSCQPPYQSALPWDRVDVAYYNLTLPHERHGFIATAPSGQWAGAEITKYDLPEEYFGEGLTDWGSTLIQLTWKEHKGFVYDRSSFSLLRTFPYEGEGWGLTHDNKQLIMSDGTSYLRFLDPKSFKETKRIRVTDETEHTVENLNELEYVRGEIYANVWNSDKIARISPTTGKILGWIDLTGIIDKRVGRARCGSERDCL